MVHKLTRNQILVLDNLKKSHTPLSAYTILNDLRNEGLRSPLQIYRALDKLIMMHYVHRLESINAFVACRHPHHKSSSLIAFAICEQCGHVDELEDSELSKSIKHITKLNHFSARHSTIEIRGACAQCSTA